ncbi:MAG: CYTH domain-containing protein [Chthoniobacter sp.]|nr:CYTH domain-containing protein [Chthoniobacter sp.]
MNLETETKLELDRRDFEGLLEGATIRKRIDQLNVYYDSGEELSRVAATFRIRYSSRRTAVMTLKLPVENSTGPRKCVEIEQQIENTKSRSVMLDQDLPEEFSNSLKQLGIECLARVGWMRTCRYVVLIDDIEVELDEVRLPSGKKYFEVEIESDRPEVHELATRLVYSRATSARPSHVSKYQRFVEAVRVQSESKRSHTPSPLAS